MARTDIPKCSEYSRETVATYYECELTPAEELRIEQHLAVCSLCKEYLNSLKMVSTSLEILLEKDPLPIPEKFTKTVQAAAQSSVDDLRSGEERSRGLFVAALLFCLVAVLVSVSTARPALAEFADGFVSLGGFIGHLFYNLSVGFSIIVGGVCSKLFFGSFAAAAGVIAILIISVYVFSKHMTRLKRS